MLAAQIARVTQLVVFEKKGRGLKWNRFWVQPVDVKNFPINKPTSINRGAPLLTYLMEFEEPVWPQ
jgi:hypothetical protein